MPNTPANNPNWKLIAWLLTASDLAYEEAHASIVSKKTDTQVFVDADDMQIVVAFRGSSSIRDWITDARFAQEDLLTSVDESVMAVHRGFLEAFESINAQLVDRVRAEMYLHPQAKLYLTGHSLGGALAILCAYEFTRIKLPVAAVVTFGQPRVGNKSFAVAYNAVLQDKTICIVAQGDPVPLLPPLLSGYRDCGTEFFIKRSGEVQVNPWIGAELFSDVFGALNSWRQFKLGLLPKHFTNNYHNAISPFA